MDGPKPVHVPHVRQDDWDDALTDKFYLSASQSPQGPKSPKEKVRSTGFMKALPSMKALENILNEKENKKEFKQDAISEEPEEEEEVEEGDKESERKGIESNFGSDKTKGDTDKIKGQLGGIDNTRGTEMIKGDTEMTKGDAEKTKGDTEKTKGDFGIGETKGEFGGNKKVHEFGTDDSGFEEHDDATITGKSTSSSYYNDSNNSIPGNSISSVPGNNISSIPGNISSHSNTNYRKSLIDLPLFAYPPRLSEQPLNVDESLEQSSHNRMSTYLTQSFETAKLQKSRQSQESGRSELPSDHSTPVVVEEATFHAIKTPKLVQQKIRKSRGPDDGLTKPVIADRDISKDSTVHMDTEGSTLNDNSVDSPRDKLKPPFSPLSKTSTEDLQTTHRTVRENEGSGNGGSNGEIWKASGNNGSNGQITNGQITNDKITNDKITNGQNGPNTGSSGGMGLSKEPNVNVFSTVPKMVPQKSMLMDDARPADTPYDRTSKVSNVSNVSNVSKVSNTSNRQRDSKTSEELSATAGTTRPVQPAQKKRFSFKALFKLRSKNHSLDKSQPSKSYSTSNLLQIDMKEKRGPPKSVPSSASLMNVFKRNKLSANMNASDLESIATKSSQPYGRKPPMNSNPPKTNPPPKAPTMPTSKSLPSLGRNKELPQLNTTVGDLGSMPPRVPGLSNSTPVSRPLPRFGLDKNEMSDTLSDDKDAVLLDDKSPGMPSVKLTDHSHKSNTNINFIREVNDDDYDPSLSPDDDYDDDNLEKNPPTKLSNSRYDTEMLLSNPNDFGSPFTVRYEPSSPRVAPKVPATSNRLDTVTGVNELPVKSSRRSLQPLSPVSPDNDLLLGEALFPKSLSVQEVESIVTLERSRSVKSIRSAKRSSYANYDGLDENVIQVHSPNPRPATSGMKRSGSILKNSTSRRDLALYTSIDETVGKNELIKESEKIKESDEIKKNENAAQNIESVNPESTLKPKTLKPESTNLGINQEGAINPANIIRDNNSYDGSMDFLEFSDYVDFDNLSFSTSPKAARNTRLETPVQSQQPTAESPISPKPVPPVLVIPDVDSESVLEETEEEEIEEKGNEEEERGLEEEEIHLSEKPSESPSPSPSPSLSVLSGNPILSSPIMETAFRTQRSDGPRPISMSFSGLKGPVFSNPREMRSSGSHQSFTLSFGEDSDSGAGDGFGGDSEDEPPSQVLRPSVKANQPKDHARTSSVELLGQKKPAGAFGGHLRSGSTDLANSHKRMPSVDLVSSKTFSSMISRWKKQPRAPPVKTVPNGVRFLSRIILYDTYNGEEYDRHPDTGTCNQLTPLLAQQIKEELNTLKSEMEVHVDSMCYTHFF